MFTGFLTGVLHERRYLQSRMSYRLVDMLGKALTGIAVAVLIYLGLKQIFISIGYQTPMATFIRYYLLGAWVGFGLPYTTFRLGWVTRDE